MPRKNVRSFGGRPAIEWTITAALESGQFERVIVSTDDDQIAQLALDAGADVPFLRHARLADDHTPVSTVTVDALARLARQGDVYATVAQLMPNCPLRDARDVVESAAAFASAGSPSQISVTRFGWQNPWWAVRMDAAGRLEPLLPEHAQARGQELPPAFAPTGAIWWARVEPLVANGTFHLPGRTGWPLAWERAVDIDTEDDWRLAELLLEHARRPAVGAIAHG